MPKPNDIPNLAPGYARHLARLYGEHPLVFSAGIASCENCGTRQGCIETIWTDDGTKPSLCEDCAEEVQRLEKLAHELAVLPSCPQRQQILDHTDTTEVLVNRLRAHDMAQCADCATLLARAAAATESAYAMPPNASGKVA
jgi:hypothetical protein